MNAFEKALVRKIAKEIPELDLYTPGLVLDVHVKGRRRGCLALGKTYDYYDLASLTKIIFTASRSIGYFSKKPGALTEPVREVLPWWKSATTPYHLLTHTAGLDWWRPFYKMLKGPAHPEARFSELQKKLSRVKPSRRRKAVYSDLDLWMMGAYLQTVYQKSLLEMWNDLHVELKLGEVFFHPGNRPRYARSRYAPTERCPWRGRVMQGEVHDENTWALAGVAPHSGLFGNAEAVSDWGLKLRRAVLKDSEVFGAPQMARRFIRRQVPPAIGDWGLGFMKPTRGHASCGRYFSAHSFGHTGFTGTSLWMDPVQDILVVILSNRVHPTRDNKRFVGLRGSLHDWICQLL